MSHCKVASILGLKKFVVIKQFIIHMHMGIKYIDTAHEQGISVVMILFLIAVIFSIIVSLIKSNVY